MIRNTLRGFVAALVMIHPLPAQDATVEEAFRDGLYQEEVKGNLEEALKVYEDVSARVNRLRDLGARALFRKGECLRKLERNEEAIACFQRVLETYPDNETIARLSRENLASLNGGVPERESTPSAIPDEEAKEIERLKRLVANSPDLINAGTNLEAPPLHMAAHRGQTNVARFLLDNGARIDLEHEGMTPLQHASRAGHLAVCRLLLDRDAPNDGLLHALKGGREAVALLLLERGANPQEGTIGWKNYPDTKALHLAIVIEKLGPKVLEALLTKNPNVNEAANARSAKGRDGSPVSFSPLSQAISQHDVEKVRLLLESAADPNAQTGGDVKSMLERALWNSEDGGKRTTSDPILTLLFAHGAEWKSGDPQVLLAAAHNQPGWLKRALEAGVDPNANPDAHFRPALHRVASRGTPETLKLLLEHGADIDLTNNEGKTALCYVSGIELSRRNECLPAVKSLLESGADPNAADGDGHTPLSQALDGWHEPWEEAIDLLLQHGADPNAGKKLEFSKQSKPGQASRGVGSVGIASEHARLFENLWRAAKLTHNSKRPHGIWLSQSLTMAQRGGPPVFESILSDQGAAAPGTLRQFLKLLRHQSNLKNVDPHHVSIARLDGSVVKVDLVEEAAKTERSSILLNWGDAIEIPLSDDLSKEWKQVLAWLDASPAGFDVRVWIGENHFYANAENATGPVFRLEDADQMPWHRFLPRTGVSMCFIQDVQLHRTNPYSDLYPSSKVDFLQHGDVIHFNLVQPNAKLSEDAMRAGIFACESPEGPFWPFKVAETWTGEMLGVELSLMAPNGLPIHPIDWEKAVIRQWDSIEATWEEEKWLERETLWEPKNGTLLILPRANTVATKAHTTLKNRLTKELSFNWKLGINDLPLVEAHYAPPFFVTEKKGETWIWRDESVPASRPLMPEIGHLYWTHPASTGTLQTNFTIDDDRVLIARTQPRILTTPRPNIRLD